MADEDLVGPELMPTRAVGRWKRHPLPAPPDQAPDDHLVVPPLTHDGIVGPTPDASSPTAENWCHTDGLRKGRVDV